MKPRVQEKRQLFDAEEEREFGRNRLNEKSLLLQSDSF